MNDAAPLIRALLLIHQKRWDMAERELHLALSNDSQSAEAHRLLALCLLQREQYDDAEAEAQSAIHLAPDEADTHLMLGWVLLARRRYAEAAVAAQESIRLNPHQVGAFELLSRLAIQENRWKDALFAAEQGLAVDPEDTDCNNLRAMALVKLGRRAEAGQTIAAALTRDPGDWQTHANQGWTLLEAGDVRKAMEHFRESLRLNPDSEWAREGIVESMKARSFVYRLCLKYFFLMSRLSVRTQWMLVIGFFLLQNMAGSISNRYPALAPFLLPVIVVYIAFALLTWLGSPLCDLLLLLDKFGRLALSTGQKWRAAAVGGLVAAAILSLGASFLFDNGLLLWGALNLALLAIPTAAIINCPDPWPRRTMLGATLLLGAVGLLPLAVAGLVPMGAINLDFAKAALGLTSSTYVWGIVGSQFLANGLAGVVVRR